MNNHVPFTFSLDIEGTLYEGTIIPSREIERNGFPVFFRVLIGDIFLANLCLGKKGWIRKDTNGKGDSQLIQRIGEYIKSSLT
jgi:hypothetical protein